MRPMERDDVHELAAAYVLDALGDEERRIFEAHLARCTVCEEELESLRQAAALLAYAAFGPAPQPALRERLLDRARADRRLARVIPLGRRLRPYALPTAAAFGLAA